MAEPTVELHLAFAWTCDDCGRDNFARAVTMAPEAIDLDGLPEDIDRDAIAEQIRLGGEGAFLKSPDRVACPHCGARFRTEEP